MLQKFEHYFTDDEILRVEDVSLSFPNDDGSEKLVLRDINISIKNVVRRDKDSTGQIVGFLGPSGRGKTQLFKIMAGLNKPTTGRVLINGQPVNPGDVGVVQQNYPLFSHHDVKGNLLLSLRNKTSMTKSEKLDKINEYLKRFKLEDKINYYPASLSGGQRQRIAIIQQLLCSENFLLLDEPFSGLDINMIKEVSDVILEVANLNEFNTIILVSHDISATAAISDLLWMLGLEYDEQGQALPGAYLKYVHDLKEMGIAWNYPHVSDEPQFLSYVKDVKNIFKTL